MLLDQAFAEHVGGNILWLLRATIGGFAENLRDLRQHNVRNLLDGTREYLFKKSRLAAQSGHLSL